MAMMQAQRHLRYLVMPVAVCLLAGAIVGCGSDSPPGPSPNETGLRFANPDGFLFVNTVQTLVAVAELSNGTTRNVQPTSWTSSNPEIATVSGTGIVTAVANGTTKVTAIYRTFSAAMDLRVAPDYNGIWSGRFNVRTCGRAPAFPIVNFCSAVALPQDIRLSLEQTRLAANGTISMFGGTGAVTGSIDPEGALLLEGSLNLTSGNAAFVATVANWRTTLVDQVLAGTFYMKWTAAGTSDVSAELIAELSSVVRAPR